MIPTRVLLATLALAIAVSSCGYLVEITTDTDPATANCVEVGNVIIARLNGGGNPFQPDWLSIRGITEISRTDQRLVCGGVAERTNCTLLRVEYGITPDRLFRGPADGAVPQDDPACG